MKLTFFLSCLVFSISLFAHNGDHNLDSPQHSSEVTEQFGVEYIGNASVGLTNKTIPLEIKDNTITWVSPETTDDTYAAYLNQGMAFLHVFHWIDALRSFKMAQEIKKDSLYAAAGQIFSYLSLNPSDAAPFIQALVKDMNGVSTATPLEKAWYDFALAMAKASNVLNQPGVKSVSQAFRDLNSLAPNDSEVSTFAAWTARQGGIQTYLDVLETQPNHLGANHYVTHMLEGAGQSANAVPFAEKVAEYGSFNGHAIHMLGHVLPEVGRWKDAVAEFEKAHQVHLDWASRNDVPMSEDWHYAHNLHLMGVSKAGIGDFQDAQSDMELGCEFDGRSCIDLFNLKILTMTPEEFTTELDNFLATLPQGWAPYFSNYYNEIALRNGQSLSEITIQDQMYQDHLVLVAKLMEAKKGNLSPTAKSQLNQTIKTFIATRFPQTGFDSWAKGVFMSLRILAITKRMDDQDYFQTAETELLKKLPELDHSYIQ